jgi:benzoyl-CoA reductase/2-hydroxyglutaryl-CoA dehydratase subunit BcrC/BadD/HgdB
MHLPSRGESLALARQRGDRSAAVLPIHYPRALLRAHGLQPIEVWAPPGQDPTAGNAQFQAYACAIVRHGAALLLAGPGQDVDLIVVPHTCDALQGLGSVLIDFIKPRQPVLTLYHPRGRRPSDQAFLANELRCLGGRLRQITGRQPSDADLHAAIDVEEEANDRLARLCLYQTGAAISDRERYTLIRSREYLPAETFVALVDTLSREPPATSEAASEDSASGLHQRSRTVRLMLGGIVPEPMALFDAIEEMGATVVADDLACGSRRLYRRTRGDDPYRRLADGLMSGPPDPTLGAPIAERADYLVRRMRESAAQGLLVYDVKFCEPELFDLPQLRDRLTAERLPMLHVEFEVAPTIAQQTISRIEAFVEMLQ